MPSIANRPVRIGSASGSATERHEVMARVAKNEDVDVMHGDWLSEYNMSTRGGEKTMGINHAAFEPTFLESLEPTLEHLAAKKIKFACNAGSSNTALLAEHVRKMIKDKGLDLKVAWISGDEVDLEDLKALQKNGDKLQRLTTDEDLDSWKFEPLYAQCYLGAFGIAEAWSKGADIVLAGRVADASPVIAAGIWWHGWTRTQFDELAGGFICGHLIECSAYLTGGNWTGFKSFGKKVCDMGFPIAELAQDGTFIVTKEQNTDGIISTETCTAQILYEIQGPLYYNSDVTAEISNVSLEQVGKDRVCVTGIKGLPPPAFTKVGVTANGGYQAEAHMFVVGLDADEKVAMLETQVRSFLPIEKYHCFKITLNGRSPINPRTQESATCDLRIFAQARNKEDLSYEKFLRPIVDNVMQCFPGGQFHTDMRQGLPKSYYEYWVCFMPQSLVRQRIHFADSNMDIDVAPPTNTQTYPRHQNSYDPESPTSLSEFGPTTFAPLGYVVHARSGDKSSNSNVGFWARHEDEYEWLRSLLTINKMKELLADDYKGKPIERFELHNIWAVHFLLFDHLDRGVASTSTYDFLGKNVSEYLRCKFVDIPNKFLERGRI